MDALENRVELSFPWKDEIKEIDKIKFCLVKSSLNIPEETKELWMDKFEKYNKENPKSKKFNGNLVRYERNYEHNGFRIFEVSITDYISLFIPKYLKIENGPYANPIGVNALQITTDGYIPLAVKQEHTENSGEVVSLGSGFIKLDKEFERESPEDILKTLKRECNEETFYSSKKPFDINESFAIGAVYGDSHDTGIVFCVPLNERHNGIYLKDINEHKDSFNCPVNKKELEKLLDQGEILGYRISDQLMGSIKLFLDNKLYEKFN